MVNRAGAGGACGLRARAARLATAAVGAVALAAASGCALGTPSGAGGAAARAGLAGDTSVEDGQTVTEVAKADRGSPVAIAGPTLDGGRVDVADLRGDVVVVNVWGSWCAPCREEAPVLAALSQELAGQGVAFVGVNVKDNPASARAFESRYGITYASIDDAGGEALLSLTQYAPANAVPVTLVLDRSGRVAARVLGQVREATLRALLQPVLAEETP